MIPTKELKPKKSEQQIFAEEWARVHSLEWLFPEQDSPVSSGDYLEEFHRRYGAMYICRCPSTYKFEFLEKHKEKVVFSQHVLNEGAVSPYTVLQYSARHHVVCDWVWNESERKFLVAATVFYSKHSDYAKFLADNVDVAHFEQSQDFGFGGLKSN